MKTMTARKFRWTLISILLPLMLIAFAGAAVAEVVGRFTRVEGAVDVMPGGKLPAVAAKSGAAVQTGDFVRTKSNARAEVTFNDGSVVKIAQRSRIDVSEYSGSARKLGLPRGKVQATVVPSPSGTAAQSFEIRTPNAIAGVRGTSFYVYHQANVTGVAVMEGVVHTASLVVPSKGVTLVAGTATTVTKRNPPTPPRPVSETELNTHKNDVTLTTQGSDAQGSAPAGGGETSGSTGSTAATTSTTSSATSTATSSGSEGSAGDSGSTPSNSTTSSSADGTTGGTATTTSSASNTTGTTVASSTSGSTFTDPVITTAALTIQADPSPAPILQVQPAPPAAPVVPVSDTREEVKEEIKEEGELVTDEPPPTEPPPTEPPPTEPPPTEPPPTEPPPTEPPPTEPPPTEPPPTEPPPTEPPPIFTGYLRAGLMSRDSTIDTASGVLTIISDPGFAPTLSGATSLWTGGAVASLGGTYPTLPLLQPNHYWFGDFYSGSTATDTTADGGAYFGYFGGMSLDGSGALGVNLSALYIDPTGKAGIMQGAIPGTFTSGVIEGTGSLLLTEANAGSGLNPSSFSAAWWDSKTGNTVVEVTGPVLSDYYTPPTGYTPPPTDGTGSTGATVPSGTTGDNFDRGGFPAEGFLLDGLDFTSELINRGDVLKLGYLSADPSFGIWTRESFGSYSGDGTRFVLISNAVWGTMDIDGYFTMQDIVTVNSLGSWQAGSSLLAAADGVWGNLNSGSIRLLTGSLIGSSNTATSTFGAVTTGAFIDVDRFLAEPLLAGSLGFPTVKGPDSFTLAGSSTTGNVSLGTIDFYKRDQADPIGIWIAPNVSGDYTGSLQQRFSLMNGATADSSTVMGNLSITSVSSTGSNTWLGMVSGLGETGSSFRSEFDGIAAGTFTGSTFSGMAAGLSHPVTYFSSIEGSSAHLTRYYNGTATSYGNIDGIMAGMSLWNSTAPLTSDFRAVGFFTPSQTLLDSDYVMSAPLVSTDVPSGQSITADGGAYNGHLIGGVVSYGTDPGISGIINALFIDPSGNAGILSGKFGGFLNQMDNVWMADGELLPVTLLPASGLTADSLNSSGITTIPLSFGTGGTYFNGTPALSGWAPGTYNRSFITAAPGWGIGEFGLYSPYFSAPAPDTPWNIDFTIAENYATSYIMNGTMGGSYWDVYSGRLYADTRAAWVDMLAAQPTAAPQTGIFIGETVGTFNPTSLQALTSGIWMETGKFLGLVATNPAALDKLNIPTVEVGKGTFSGGNGDFDVTLTDLTFFARVGSSSGRPEVFATDKITGSYYVAAPSGSATLTQVTGNTSGLTPTFNIKQWDTSNNKWGASIEFSGTGGVVNGNSNIQMTGVAAGSSSGGVPGTFSGTAAGLVK